MKKYIIAAVAAAAIIIAVTAIALFSRSKRQDESWKNNEKYDLSLPVLNSDGWYLVFEDDFSGSSLNEGIVFGERYTGNKEINSGLT